MQSTHRPRINDSDLARQVTDEPVVDLALTHWRRILWQLTSWLRWYVKSFPVARGRGVVLRWLITPMLPRDGAYRVLMPSGHEIRVGYREHIGISFAIYGDFERHERQALRRCALCGTTAVDVGANIGIYSLDLSKAVGNLGSVIAIEPWPDNVRRLKEAIACNGTANVRVLACAVGSNSRTVEMYGGRDPAYVTSIPAHSGILYTVVNAIEQRTLDEIWIDAGSPRISVLKIDVEGTELEVLRGARRLLAGCHPTLLCEANTSGKSDLLAQFLREFGYRPRRPPGFEPWNVLFVREGANDRDLPT